MSEQELNEIVQITVEDFNQENRTGKIPLQKKWSLYSFYNIRLGLSRHLVLFSWVEAHLHSRSQI